MEISISQTQSTKRDYVCAVCWSELHITHSKTDRLMIAVHCIENPEHQGIIRRDYIRRLQAEDAAKAREARRNIGHLLGLETPARSAEQEINRLFPHGEEE